MNNILVLCVGNICRSPIAEALFKRELSDKKLWSAGLTALIGNPADPFSSEVARAHGVDLSAHRAQQLAGWMCKSAELILVMEQTHKTQVEQQYPLTRGRVFRLGHMRNLDIADPYRQPRAAFEVCYADIANCVDDWVPRIRLIS